MIRDLTTINGTRYVIERSWIRSPVGCAILHVTKLWLFQGHSFLNLYMHINIYIWYICLIALTISYMTTINGIQNGKKKLISSIKLKRVINSNPLWWSHHIRFPWKLFGMELNHWHMNKTQKALAPSNDLASIARMNKIAILCARIKTYWLCREPYHKISFFCMSS